MRALFPLYADFREGVDPRVLWTRSGNATVFTPEGRWRNAPPNTPRRTALDGAALLGLGGQVNLLTNPLATTGAVVGVTGSGGSRPTGWTSTFVQLNTIVATGSTGSVSWTELQGTSTTSGLARLGLGVANLIESLPYTGQVWVGAAAPFPPEVSGINWRLTGTSAPTTRTLIPPTDGTLYRAVETWTAAATGPSTTFIDINFTAACTFNIRVGWNDLRQTSFAEEPLLPALAGLGPVTSSPDSATLLFDDFRLTPAGSGVFLVAFRPGVLGDVQTIASISDGTNNNSLILTTQANGTVRAELTVGGVSQGTGSTSLQSVAAFAECVAVVRIVPGEVALSLNGAAPRIQTFTTLLPNFSQVNLLGHGGTISRVGFLPISAVRRTTLADTLTLARQGIG